MVIKEDDEEMVPFISPEEGKSNGRKEFEIAVLMVLVICLGAANRVCSKIMSEPMANYSFFLSLFNGLAYVLCYGIILGVRTALGRVSKRSLMFPWRRPPESPSQPSYCDGGKFWAVWDKMWGIKYFIFTGFLEGLGNILGVIANPYISGIMGSLATQTMLLFAMPSAIIMLGTRYTIWQCLGALAVLIGAMVAVLPDLITSNESSGPIGYILLMSISNLPNAISFTIKELIFKKEKTLEVFVVNTMGSLFQLLWWPIMIPLTILLKQTEGQPLMEYIRDGFKCFVGISPSHLDPKQCSAMPYPYLAYICFNLSFNICLLYLLKKASALQGFMAVKAILPVSVFLFLIHWPLIGSTSLTPQTTASLILILTGLILYRWATFEKEREVILPTLE